MKRNAVLFGPLTMALYVLSTPTFGADCPVEVLPGSPGTPENTLNEEFGPGTQELTTCLENREDVKIVMQLN